MNNDTFIAILKERQKIKQLETAELKTIVDDYPYFQSARALYLKGLKNQDSFKYNNELKITAAHTADRTVLFDFITSKEFDNAKNEIHKQISSKISEEKPIEKISETTLDNTEKTLKSVGIPEEKLQIGKPIQFVKSENYSFNEWLQLASKKPIERTEIKAKPVSKKEKIIEKFIKTNPKIEPLSKDKSVSIAVAKNKQDSSLMTETLAKVYLEQKKYENAIQAYRILSLKYPEKSGFFADQIKRVQILQKHK
ncbi:hypothetical protein [Polaribacter sp.]|uniref:hypothetical protein n=1 Tax=Polaribacter sp. TaxID=1920175 RepID=UPI003F6D6C3D